MKFEKLFALVATYISIVHAQVKPPGISTEGAASIISGQVSIEPAIVGQKKAQLMIQFYTTIDLPIGSTIEVSVPEGSSVVQSSSNNIICAISGWIDDDGLICSAKDEKTLLFPVRHLLKAYEQNVFRFYEAYNAPQTGDPTESFVVTIYNKEKTSVLAYTDKEIELQSLEPNFLRSVAIVQNSGKSTIVGDETQIIVSVTTLNPIPAGGGLKIDIPKWNNQAKDTQRVSYIIQDDKAICSIQSGMSQIQCDLIVSPISDTLIVKNMFKTAGVPAGSTFSFIVNRVRNPLSISAIEMTLTTWTSIIFENPGLSVSFRGLIDKGPGLFKAKLPVPIDPASSIINADSSVVSEQTTLIIPFKIPVPVQLALGCTILITLPDDFEVVDGKLTQFRGWGIFQGVTELVASVDQQQKTVKIEDQCVKYSQANIQNTIKIGTIKNPALVKPTKSFKIQILDKSGALIAALETGATFTPTPGTFSAIALVPHSPRVQILEKTDVELVFTPQNQLSIQAQLKIKMPSDLPAKCNIVATSGGMNMNPTCFVEADGTIVLQNAFAKQPYFGGQQLSITFGSLQLPDSQRPILGISIESYDVAGTQYYLVDSFSSLTYQFFTPKALHFIFNKITKNTEFTYTETLFKFSSTVAGGIPAGSVLHIEIPKQVTITSAIAVQSSCTDLNNMSPSLACTLIANTDDTPQRVPDGSHTVKITGAFDLGKKDNDEILIQIRRGLVTPISTETTDSFKVFVFDKKGYLVNFITEALTMTVSDGTPIETVQVVPESYRVGNVTKHSLKFQSPVPILKGFKLQIFVPKAVITPKAADLVCQGKQPLIVNLKCQLNGNRVTVELETLRPVAVNEDIQLTIGPMINPGSTLASESYHLSIRSSTWYEVAKSQEYEGAKVRMRDPSIISPSTVAFTAFDQRQLALTTITIDWTSTQTYPQDTRIVIDYDRTQISPNITSLTQTVDCIFRQSIIRQCVFTDNQIFINEIMPSEEYGNSKMQLTITNMKINVVKPLVTTSWVLTTYLNDRVSLIDQIPGGMSLTFNCDYPCQNCLPGQPDVCTQCNNVEADHILYKQKCYLQCPAGTFFEYFTCQLCSQKCKTCQYTSGTSCTSCNGQSPYPYLNGKDCSDRCNYREFGNALTNRCEQCAYSCDGCTETATKCTSCRQENLDKYLFQNRCLPQCPQGYYVDLEARDNVCLACSSECLTCELTANTCSSCRSGKILNQLDSTCVTSCPADLTVLMEATASRSATCEPCKSSCKTCAGTIDTCTSCRNPLSLRKPENKCVLECDVFFQSQVSINNVCIGCSSSCLRCRGTPDYCIECVPGTYFYQNHCVKQCPLIGDYQYEPNEDGICVINGLICQFGWKLTPDKQACELNNQVCEPEYELNDEKTACVPISSFYVPFPILITAVLASILPIVSKVKFRDTKIVPNLTVVFSFFETLCLIVLVAQAHTYGIIPTFYLSVVGLIFLFASNMFFALMYTQQVVNDSAFKHWQPKFKRTALVVQVCGLFNFKIFRLLYSLLLARNQFNAPFNEPSLFLRPFNLTSLFAIVTVALPTIVSSGIGLIYVRWGYQLYITCLEMILIEVILVTLQVIEYIQQRFIQKKYFKVTKKQVEVKVCSDFPDSDENDEIGNKKDYSKSKPKSIKAVRQLNYLVTRMQGKEDFAGELNREVAKEIEELHVEDMMHRQLRHCQSFRLLRPALDEAFPGDVESDEFQDFISEPGSPRSKEMLFNRKFVGRMHYLHDVYKMRDQFDNCYHEVVERTGKNKNPVTRKVQTNVLEMLGIDDAKVSEQQQVSDNLEASVDGDDLTSEQGDGKKRRLSKKRIMEIPDFEFEDLLGDFEADETGQYLLVQKQGRLHDKRGRLVNRRGYLIDQIGNVVNRMGKLIFRVDELQQEDDELPEPFCYHKIQALRSQKNQYQFRVTLHSHVVEDKAKLQVQNILIEQQYQEKKQSKNVSSRSHLLNSKESVESSSEQLLQPAQETSVREEEDALIQRLTQPKSAKTKDEFFQAKTKKAEVQAKNNNLNKLIDKQEPPIYQAMRPASQTSVHRVEQLQEIIQMKDLQFSNQKRGKAAPIRHNQASLNKYVPGQEVAKVYEDYQQRIDSQRTQVKLDQDFIERMDQFSKQFDMRRKEGRYSVNAASDIAKQMENRGLAHRDLSKVYGRVKHKFNENMVKEAGPSAAINRNVSGKMQELEEIYMRPRVDGKELRRRNGANLATEQSLDINNQVQGIHHKKPPLAYSNQISAMDAQSQNQQVERALL